MRVMELADRLGFPLVTLVDTPGAYPGVAAEQHGQGGAIARSQAAMAAADVPTVATRDRRGRLGRRGRARGRGPRADAGARDLLGDLARGLRRDPLARRREAKKAAAAFKPDAAHCLELGVIDGIVPEPRGRRADRPRRGRRLLERRSSMRSRSSRAAGGRAAPAPAREVPRDGRPRPSEREPQCPQAFPRPPNRLSAEAARNWPRAVESLDGKSARDPACPVPDDETSTAVEASSRPWRARRLPAQARPEARRRSRSAEAAGGPTARSSSSSATTPGGSTTTSGSSGTARSRPGRCRRACRWSPASAPLAVHVEDHPLDYATFEGEIPAGPVRRGHRRDLGQAAPTSSSRRSATAASPSASTASGSTASGRSCRRSSTATSRTGS